MKKLFFLLLIIAVSCKPPQAFEYRDVKNIKIQKIGFNQSTLNMDLIYYNPNNFGVDLKRIDCDIYIDNNYLGKFELDTIMHIKRNAEFALPSSIKVDMQNIFKNTFNLLFSKDVLVNVSGNAKVGKAGVFITYPFKYEGRHKMELF